MGIAELTRKHPLRSLAVIILLHLFSHAPFVQLPPCSIHVWRQCNTLAVARNFHQEDSNILKPRIDRRGTGDGVTGMQFPFYEWSLSKLYSLTGEEYWVHRIYSLLISSIAIIAMFFFLREAGRDSFLALAGAWCLTWSPEFYYHGMNALPDILALSSAIAACYAFLRWIHRGGKRYFAITFLLLTLAGLIKIQYFMITAFMAGTLISQQFSFRNLFRDKLLRFMIAGIVSGIIILSWYTYAGKLIRESGLHDFVLEVRPAASLTDGFKILQRNLISDFPELILNYAGLILVMAALLMLKKEKLKQRPVVLGFVLLAASYTLFHVLELYQMRVHQYYMLPSLIFLAPLMAVGTIWLYKKDKFRKLALVLLIAAPVLCMLRIVPARWAREDLGIPKAFTDEGSLARLRSASPHGERIITGSDPSGCIFFYFLDRKGISFQDAISELVKPEFSDFQYLYLYRKTAAEPWKEIWKEGDWTVYRKESH